jgi:hypothetical protein
MLTDQHYVDGIVPRSAATEFYPHTFQPISNSLNVPVDRLCGPVVRVLDYRSRGPGFDSRALQKKSSGSATGSTQPREYN